MKNLKTLTFALVTVFLPMHGNVTPPTTVNIDGTDYELNTLINRRIGPGTDYLRMRMPGYPLNINMLVVDLNNPHVTIETTQANDRLFGTERLVDAAARRSHQGHRAFAGANANFWCVTTSYPYSDLLIGATFNGNLANGKIITETNCASDQWDHGPAYIGEVALTADRRVISDHLTFKATCSAASIGELDIQQVNRITRAGEICMYNDYFGPDREFLCADMYWNENGIPHFTRLEGVATEVLLRKTDGETWHSGAPMTFEVTEVRTAAGTGRLGQADLALVGRDANATALANLKPGETLTLNYNWVLTDGSSPELTQLIGGNGQIMIDGQLTELNTLSENCALVYSKTCYGTSADNKTLYVFVADKSTDPVYGISAGCTSAVMCQLARYFGCANLTNFDSGGSAQLLVEDAIVNKTTEGTPRAVANGWLVYSTAPDDNEVARIVFEEKALRVPVNATVSPDIVAYNQYDDILTHRLSGAALGGEGLGSGTGSFKAPGTPGQYTLTATYGAATATIPVEVVEATPAIVLNPIVIDRDHPYTVEVNALVDDKPFGYDGRYIDWTVSDADGAFAIDNEGTLTALADQGTGTLTAAIGNYTSASQVSVECPKAETEKAAQWSQFTLKGATGVSSPKLSDDGRTVTFSMTANPRNPCLTLTAETRFYGFPTAVTLPFSSDVAVENILVDLRTPAHTRANNLEITNTDGSAFEAGAEHSLSLPLASLGDMTYNGSYPVTLHSIKFTFAKTGVTAGTYALKLGDLTARYNYDPDGIEDITAPADSAASGPVEYFNLQGMRLTNPTPGQIVITRQGSKVTKQVK